MLLRSTLALLLVAVLPACGGTSTDTGVDAQATDTGPLDSGPPPPFELTSTAFANGGMVPLLHECGPPAVPGGPGSNITPPLAWTAGPPQTMSYALVVRDIDAGGIVHWVVYDIAATTFLLPQGVPDGYAPAVLGGAHQAELQGSGYFGYMGPCSPGIVNTYRFTMHALATSTPPGVDMTTTENTAATIIEGASIASAVLDGES